MKLRFLIPFISMVVTVWLLHVLIMTQVKVTDDTQAPDLLAGDRLLVNRWSYGLRLPFGNEYEEVRLGEQQAERNDWVYYNCPLDSATHIHERGTYVGKITAIPGDTVWLDTLTNNISLHPFTHLMPLVVPGKSITCRVRAWNIKWLAYALATHEGKKVGMVNDTTLLVNGQPHHDITMQQDYYWLSAGRQEVAPNSLHFGFLPHSHLIGRAWALSYSTDANRPWHKAWRRGRSFFLLQ